MTTQRITVVLTADGKDLTGTFEVSANEAKKFGRALDGAAKEADDLAGSTQRASRSMVAFRGTAAAATAILAGRAFLSAADEMTLLDSRLKIVTSSYNDFTAAQRDTLAVARETSTDIGATVQLYSRLQRSVEDLGQGQEEALRLTETINKSFQITGATSAEASGSIRQLSQAFAAGVLRGDEYNSVLEQAPRIIDAIRVETGKTIGELRELADEGGLTADILVASLTNAADSIDREYEQVEDTVGKALTRLSIVAKARIKEMSDELGILEKAILAIDAVTEGIENKDDEPGGGRGDGRRGGFFDRALGLPTQLRDATDGVNIFLDVIEGIEQTFHDANEAGVDFAKLVGRGLQQLGSISAQAGENIDEFVEDTDKLTAKLTAQREALQFTTLELVEQAAARAKTIADTPEEIALIDEATEAYRAEFLAIKALNDAKAEGEKRDKQLRDEADAVKELESALADLQLEAGLVTREERQLAQAADIVTAAAERQIITVSQANALMRALAESLEDTCEKSDKAGKCLTEFEQRLKDIDDFTLDSLGRAFGDFFGDLELDFNRLFDDLVRIAQQRSSELFQAGFADFINNKGFTSGNIATFAQAAAPGAVSLFGGNAQGAQIGSLAGSLIAPLLTTSLNAIVPVIGGIVGSIIGGVLGNIFDDSNPPRVAVVNNLTGAAGIADPNGTQALSVFTDQFGNRISIALHEQTEEFAGANREASQDLLNLLTNLDSTIFAFLDRQQQLAVGQQLVPGGDTETRSLFEGDFTAVEIAEDRFRQILGAFSETVQEAVRSFGTDLDSSVQALKDVLDIERVIQAGQGPLADLGLERALDVIMDLNVGGETLGETFNRISLATVSYQAALDLLGQTYEGNSEQLIRFATQIADQAGGIDRARQLWGAFLSETFLSTEELAQAQLSLAQARSAAELNDIGLSAGTSAADFRTLFEEALPTLSAEAIVQWLEAAEALGVVINLEEQLAIARGEGALTAEQLAAQEASLAQARAALTSDIERLTLTEFQADLRQLTRTFAEQRVELEALGGTAEDAALLQRRYRLELEALVQQLREDTGDLVAELYGTPLSLIQDQIDAITQRTIAGNDAVVRSTENRVRSELASLNRLQRFIESLLLDPKLSGLTADEQFAEAQRIFEETLAAASTDIDAFNNLPEAARGFLDIARQRFASSEAYQDIFNAIVAALQDVQAPPGADGDLGGITTGGGTIQVQDPELESLLAERDRLLAEQEAQHRATLALQLAENLRDLSIATGTSIGALATQMGVNLASLVQDLGVNLDAMTVATALQLADVATSLGTDLGSLASSLDISLGSLVNDQSLINDALEQRIGELPSGIQGQLSPLLEAVESATTAADANAALEELETATAALPVEFRDLLAPFFASIDPSDGDTTLATIRGINADMLEVLRDIRGALTGDGQDDSPAPTPSSFNGGSGGSLPSFLPTGPDQARSEEMLEQLVRTNKELVEAIREQTQAQQTRVRA